MAKRGRKGKPRAAAARGGAATGEEQRAPERSTGPSEPTAPAAHASEPPAAAAEAAPQSRVLSNALIVLFLGYQIAMPLRYYLSGGGYDERFSWRMFSTLRMQSCSVDVREETADAGERTVDLRQELQIAWIGMLERYRRAVVDKLLQRRCELPEVRKVRFERSCVDTDNSVLPKTVIALDCKTGAVETEHDPDAAP